jgi:glycosyltransferase involved in cell wall biosynthesis
MIESMRVDILMPVYGSAPYLSESIISILEDMQPIDKLIIILDRASTNVVLIANFYSRIDKRIQIIESASPGISSALNKGIVASTADFLARIDCDDKILPGRLNVQRKFLKRRKNYVLVGSSYFNINENGIRYKSTILPSSHLSIKNLLLIKNPIAHPSVMFKRDAVIRSGGYNSEYDGIEDYELWVRLQEYGKFKNLNRRLIEYRSTTSQSSKNRNSTVLDKQMQMLYADKILKLTANYNKLNLIYQIYFRRNPHSYISLMLYFANTKLKKVQFKQIFKLSIVNFKLFIIIIFNVFAIKFKTILMGFKK